MLDKLIEFLLNIIDQVIPFKIIMQYEKGVVFRVGKFIGVKEPGLHWKIPFFDVISNYTVVTTTITLPPQSLTTRDGKSIVVRAQIKYKICDLSKYAVDVYDTTDALSDTTCGIIHDIVADTDWHVLRSKSLKSTLTSEVQPQALDWGIDVAQVTITDLAEMRSYRLFNSDATLV